MMVSWDWLVEVFPMKEELRYVWTMPGEPSVMMAGETVMLVLFAVNSDIMQQVIWCLNPWNMFPTPLPMHLHFPFLFPKSTIDAVAFLNSVYGPGIGPQFFEGFACTGSEIMLTQCSTSSSVHCYYGHNEDAGVRCQSEFVNGSMQNPWWASCCDC